VIEIKRERKKRRERERERESDTLSKGQKRDPRKSKNKEGEPSENPRKTRELEDDRRLDSLWVSDGTTPTEPGANSDGTKVGFPAIFCKISSGLKSNFRWGDFDDFGNF
jgi:hypothetical protein